MDIVKTVRRYLGIKSTAESTATSGSSKSVDIVALFKDATLFHSDAKRAYASVDVNGHRETLDIDSTEFRMLARALCFAATGEPPSRQSVEDAIEALKANSIYRGPVRPVFLRVGRWKGAIYIDLGDSKWRAIKIDASGWRIMKNPRVHFRRSARTGSLPTPKRGGELSRLRLLVCLPDDDAWRLLVAWLTFALRPNGPYPLLVLQGEHGSSKSTCARSIQSLVDPSMAPITSIPASERDLMIATESAWLLNFDNISALAPRQSDWYCRISTGIAFSVRTLYSNRGEELFVAMRPIVINGIDEIATRPDLADRSIVVRLPPIPDKQRLDEATYWARVKAESPAILGALFDAISMAMKILPSVQLEGLPRMADFAKWGVAVERALGWPEGSFLRALEENRSETAEAAFSSDLVAEAVMTFMSDRNQWKGTSTELLRILTDLIPDVAKRSTNWPKDGRVLTDRLRRAAPLFRRKGLDVLESREGRRSTRCKTLIWRMPKSSDHSDAAGGVHNESGSSCHNSPRADDADAWDNTADILSEN